VQVSTSCIPYLIMGRGAHHPSRVLVPRTGLPYALQPFGGSQSPVFPSLAYTGRRIGWHGPRLTSVKRSLRFSPRSMPLPLPISTNPCLPVSFPLVSSFPLFHSSRELLLLILRLCPCAHPFAAHLSLARLASDNSAYAPRPRKP
jgi:hypothetical protein